MLLPVLRQCRSNAAVAAALPPALTLLRPLWSDSMDRSEARRAESFYDGTVINYAERPVQRLSLDQVMPQPTAHRTNTVLARDCWHLRCASNAMQCRNMHTDAAHGQECPL